MVDGNGIQIDDRGEYLLFEETGSYKFEFNGTTIPYSDVNIILQIKKHNDVEIVVGSGKDKHDDSLDMFTKFLLENDKGKIQMKNISTILPIDKGEIYYLDVTPFNAPRMLMSDNSDEDIEEKSLESIILLSGAKLLVYRVS